MSKVETTLETLTDEQLDAVVTMINQESGEVSHSDSTLSPEEVDSILATLTDEQADAIAAVIENPEMLSDDGEPEPKQDPAPEPQPEQGEQEMSHNIFAKKVEGAKPDDILTHADEEAIFADAAAEGSLHDSIIKHGVDPQSIGVLFPEANNITPGGLLTIHDPLTSTDQILSGVSRYPKGKIKVRYANLGATQKEVDENMRAKGYIKGNFKKEQVFGLLGRSTDTTTIYKKQGIDRDDLLDLEDFDMVRYYWQEMRMMLNEEIARAILVGDGRAAVGTDGNPNPDKIDSSKLKPIKTDDDFYTLKRKYTNVTDLIEEVVRARKEMLGSGNNTLYVSVGLLDDMYLIKDTLGRYIWTDQALKSAMRVTNIVETSLIPEGEALLGNLSDYTVSANKGGEIFTANDFDIDYNKYKYLIETRVGGMVTRPKAFVWFTKTAEAAAPTEG